MHGLAQCLRVTYCVCRSSNAQVTTLSRLNHQYVVRYFQAWTEGGKSTLNWLVTQ
jgi:hypothetical protein